MGKLIVSVEQMGQMIPVGSISGNSLADAYFCYHDEYAEKNDAVPISVSLPLEKKEFTPEETRTFFEGMLPEGFTRRAVAKWMHRDDYDYLSILHGLGRECLGAVNISAPGEQAVCSYEPVSGQQLRDFAAEGALKSAEIVTKTHLSLTGASGKAGLYMAPDNKTWYLPRGTAPSTHIVKQSHVRLGSIVENEQLCMKTAERCGIDTPRSFIVNTGGGGEGELLFATPRYDRSFESDSELISGLPRPLRLHQEDFAQAMGIPASEKYETGDEHYLRRMFDTLRKHSSDPIGDQMKMWDMVVFDFLIGNTDSHIKNFSLLYSPDLKSVRLSKAYDIVSTAIYEQSTRDMAFGIGGINVLDQIDAASFERAAEEAGIGRRIAMRRFDRMCGVFENALAESARELQDEGVIRASELAERMLECGGYKRLYKTSGMA